MTLMAPSDRPREKLMRVGVEALGDNELLALVLGSGTRARGALTLGQDVLTTSGGVQGLTRLGIDELTRVPGVGVPRAARLVAAVELRTTRVGALRTASGCSCASPPTRRTT